MTFFQNMVVGIILLGALSILGYYTIVSDAGPFSKEGKQIVIIFDNSEGLSKSSDVTLLGIPVGHVEAITLVPVNNKNQIVDVDSKNYIGFKVAITAGIDEPFPFYGNYRIMVKNESLLASRMIYIDPGSPNGKMDSKKMLSVLYMDRKTLKKMNKTAVQYLMETKKIQNVYELSGETGKDPIGDFANLFSENKHNMHIANKNIADVTEKLNSGKGTLGRLLNDEEIHYAAHSLINDAEIVAREMRKETEEKREKAPMESLFHITLTALGLGLL